MSKNRNLSSKGFSLIEVIVALVLISIAAASLVTYISHSANQVNRPRETLRDILSLQAVMENVVARHNALMDVDSLSAEIGSEGNSVDNNFGVYYVRHNRFVEFDGANEEMSAVTNELLKVSIQNDLGESLTRLFVRSP
jgi:prepilin-type N-terminal cleavage/methylation domain-containing protein